MTVERRWACSCEVQLSFADVAMEVVSSIIGVAPPGFQFEDLTARGWGPALVRAESWQGDRRLLSALLIDFIEPLSGAVKEIYRVSGVSPCVRLGIFFNGIDFTWQANASALRLLVEVDAELEISFYPSGTDPAQ